MRAAGKVLWFVESNFRKDIGLDEIAAACGVSRFHMCRGFAAATGFSVMGYLRGRRLTEAARQLAAGAPSILDVALDAGYGSHQAFTRAFREHFGATPESVREGAVVDQSLLVEPIGMDRAAQKTIDLPDPREEKAGAMTIVGLAERYAYNDVGGIPSQWSAFQPYEGTLGEKPGLWYGVSDAFDESAGTFRYTCGVAVESPQDIPQALARINIPAQTYLAFTHSAHISELRRTLQAIWGEYIPACPFEAEEGQPILEVYDERFDPRTGLGGLEIWVPVKG